MKVSVDQYCINVTDLEKSVEFYEKTLGLTITHRIEEKEFREVVLAGESGNRIQLAWQRNQDGPIVHGNGFWKLYLQTDDCKGLYQRCIDAGAESVMEPERLEEHQDIEDHRPERQPQRQLESWDEAPEIDR